MPSAAGNLLVNPNGNGLNIQVTNVSSDVVSIAFAGRTVTFEVFAPGDIPGANVVAVPILAGDATADIAARLSAAINSQFVTTTPSVSVGQSGSSVTLSTTPLAITGSGASGFTTNSGTGTLDVNVITAPTPTAAPTAAVPNPPTGDTLTLNVGSTTMTFEFIEAGAVTTGSNIPIAVRDFLAPTPPDAGASQAEIDEFNAALVNHQNALRASAADQLNTAIKAELLAANVGVVASIDGRLGSLPSHGSAGRHHSGETTGYHARQHHSSV